MLKTQDNGKTWLITQPAHGRVAGYLAAHWGNDKFTSPGYFADSPDPERLWAETVLAIAEHDNGWWEWEAVPELSEADGFPLAISELLKNRQDGMNRWRLGIPRFSGDHPYLSLLTSFHAYWLYSHGCHDDPDPAFTHLLFWKGSSAHLYGDELDASHAFLEEIKGIQDELISRLREDPATAAWVDPEHLHPHVRLLQHLDGLSLSLCSALIPGHTGETKGLGADAFDLLEVPRRSWEDRVTLHLRPVGERQIELSPYPFDVDPLPVPVVARIVDSLNGKKVDYRLRAVTIPEQVVMYEFRSKG